METITSGGVVRQFLVRTPAGYDGARMTPLVIAFSGGGATGQSMADMTALGGALGLRNWIGVFPEALGAPPSWNIYGFANAPDDSLFVADMLAQIETALCIETGSVFVTGYADGGGMALRFACDRADAVAAVAPVAATYIQCQAAVPLIALHGSKDAVTPYDGGRSPIPGVQYPAVHRATSEWAKALGCDGLPTISRAAPNVELSTYRRCTGGDGDALLYTVLDGGHTWPGAAVDLPADTQGATSHEISANELLLDFFARHAR